MSKGVRLQLVDEIPTEDLCQPWIVANIERLDDLKGRSELIGLTGDELVDEVLRQLDFGVYGRYAVAPSAGCCEVLVPSRTERRARRDQAARQLGHGGVVFGQVRHGLRVRRPECSSRSQRDGNRKPLLDFEHGALAEGSSQLGRGGADGPGERAGTEPEAAVRMPGDDDDNR